jgi:hypothetical protein
MGSAAVTIYATIDDRISAAFGIPLVRDENRP